MSSNSQDQEIDLGQVIGKIGNFFTSILDRFFDFFLFVKRNIIVLSILFIIGAGLGFYLDRTSKQFKSEVIVTSSLGGTDYLYSKVNLLSSKVKENDTLYLNKIGLKQIKFIQKISIDPIIDIYNYIDDYPNGEKESSKFALIRLFAENEDLNEVIKNEITSKNYPNHKITITTSHKINKEEIVEPILKYLNSDEYLNKILSITNENIQIKMEKNLEQIQQVDKLIAQISENLGKEKTNSSLIFNNENTETNELFSLKNRLLSEIASQKLQLVNTESYIKDISTTLNILITKGINNKMKLILPIVFIFLFLLMSLLKNYYKKQVLKRNLA